MIYIEQGFLWYYEEAVNELNMNNSGVNKFELELRELEPKVRKKALEIAHKLMLEKKYSEEKAIEAGIKQAEKWFIDLEG